MWMLPVFNNVIDTEWTKTIPYKVIFSMSDISMVIFKCCFCSSTRHFRRTLLNSTTVLFDSTVKPV